MLASYEFSPESRLTYHAHSRIYKTPSYPDSISGDSKLTYNLLVRVIGLRVHIEVRVLLKSIKNFSDLSCVKNAKKYLHSYRVRHFVCQY